MSVVIKVINIISCLQSTLF